MDEEQDDPGVIERLFGPAEAEAGIVPSHAVPKGTLSKVLRSFPRFFRDMLTSRKTQKYTVAPKTFAPAGSGGTTHSYSPELTRGEQWDADVWGVPSRGGHVDYARSTDPRDLFRVLRHELTHVLQGMGAGPLATDASLRTLANRRPQDLELLLPSRGYYKQGQAPVELPAYASEWAMKSFADPRNFRTSEVTGREFIEELRQAAKQFRKMRKGGTIGGSPE